MQRISVHRRMNTKIHRFSFELIVDLASFSVFSTSFYKINSAVASRANCFHNSSLNFRILHKFTPLPFHRISGALNSFPGKPKPSMHSIQLLISF
jgi:hypothetical protein